MSRRVVDWLTKLKGKNHAAVLRSSYVRFLKSVIFVYFFPAIAQTTTCAKQGITWASSLLKNIFDFYISTVCRHQNINIVECYMHHVPINHVLLRNKSADNESTSTKK